MESLQTTVTPFTTNKREFVKTRYSSVPRESSIKYFRGLVIDAFISIQAGV
jgi:hypothetical protein